MKVRKITWKAKNGEPLVTYELGTHDLVINAYKTDAEQAHELMNALREAIDLIMESEKQLESVPLAQRRD